MLGANEKGGMDEAEFFKYLETNVLPLYPNAAPEKGKWVILKCDSGPGRENIELLAELRDSGFILFPGVPNATAVHQETDQNYGPFKTAYVQSLQEVIDERVHQKKPSCIPPWMVGMVVFGGRDSETGLVVKRNAFEDGFSRDKCQRAWAKVGAVPVSRECLNDKKVRKSIGDGDEEHDELCRAIQLANQLAVHTLEEFGYDGSPYKDEIKKREKKINVTEPHTLERQLLVAKATTAGKKFTATNASHLTAVDIFVGAEYGYREKEHKRLMAEKKRRLRAMAIEERALHLWNNTKEGSKLRVKDVEDLLAWHKVKKVGDMSKDEKFKAWEEIARKGTVPPKCDRWTDEDEMALIESARMDLGVADTALGRLRARKKADFVRTARKFTPEEWDAMCAARNLDMAADQVDNDANVGGDVGDDVGNEDREEEAV